MSTVPNIFYTGGQLSNIAASIASAPSNIQAAIITAATFTNTDSVPRTFSLWIVRSGGATSSANQLIVNKQLTAGQDYIAVELLQQMLAPGDAIWAVADAAAKVTCTGISGYLLTQ